MAVAYLFDYQVHDTVRRGQHVQLVDEGAAAVEPDDVVLLVAQQSHVRKLADLGQLAPDDAFACYPVSALSFFFSRLPSAEILKGFFLFLPGTDVMIFKIFSPKNLAKKLALLAQNTVSF
jgi:hypothetical protein